MSPEDLALFREKTTELLESNNHAPRLFGSILNDAICHIDAQAAQIEAMKEKLVGIYAEDIDTGGDAMKTAKMSRAEALRVAALALSVAVCCGDLQGEPFDSALMKLEEYYDIPAIRERYQKVD